MLRHPPIIRCFVTLCFGSAVLLAGLEWHQLSIEPRVASPTAARLRLQFASLSQWKSYRQRQHIDAAADVADSEPATTVRLVVRLASRQLEVYEQDQRVKQYDVAIGKDDWQTPVGEFEVTQMQQQPAWQHPITKAVIEPGPDNPLGPRWIGFWQEDGSQIGFHGTYQEELVGQAVSHGCVRMRNSDIQDLYSRIQLGTPVSVIP